MIGGGAQKITVEIGGKIAASLKASLRSAQTQVSSFGRNVNRTMNDAATAGRKGFKGMFDNNLWQGAAAGATAIGVGMAASVRVAANFEGVLTEIGKTANVSQGDLKLLSGEILKLSGRNITNLGPAKLAEGVQDLVAQGLNIKDAVASMESLGRVATATGSDLLDVTKTGFQLQNALKIRPTELKATFDALAFAGKQGAFELKDMAQFMPNIASSAAKLGISGKQGAVSLAAMMQMVRKDAPDSAQAATRLTDAFEKMMSPTVGKAFEKFGVNIESVMKNAQAKGLNPMEAAITKLQEVTGGDPFKIAQIFGDKEARAAVTSLIKYRKEYEKLKGDAGGAAAAGTVDKDFQRSIQSFAGTLASFQNSSQRLGISVGNALLPPLTRLAEIITPAVEGIASWAAANPGLMTGIVGISAALSGLVLALPVIAGVVSAIGTIGTAIGAATTAFPVLAGIGTVIAVAAGPITGVILAIVGVGLAIKAIIDYWPQITSTWGKFAGWIGNVFNQALGVIRAWGSKVLGVMRSIPAMIISLFTGSNLGQRIMTSIIDGLKAKAGALFGWIRNTWSNITGFFGGDANPGAPAVSGGAAGRAATGGQRSGRTNLPGRAFGGSVRAGMPYIVGEKRRELFVPGMDGAIIPKIARPLPQSAAPVNVQLPMQQQRAAAPVTINAPITINAAGGDAMDIRRQVELAFVDIQRQIESAHRVLLND